MPAYNADRYIGEALSSLLRQTLADFEVIVVDGGSTDSTAAVVEALASSDSRIRLERRQRTGIVDGRNDGAELARGEYLGWLDADDSAVPARLAQQIAFLDAHPRVAAVGGAMVATNAAGRPLLTVRYPTSPHAISSTLMHGNALAASTVLMRTATYRAVGGCRQVFKQGAEDYDLWLRFSEVDELANLPDVLGYYRTHPRQVSSGGIERFVIPTVAAQLSARARRAGRDDRYGRLEYFTYERLVELEGSADLVNRLILDVAAGQAAFLALIGQAESGLALLSWAETVARLTPIRGRTRARVHLAHGVAAWQSRDVPRTVSSLARSVVSDPRYLGLTIAKALRANLARPSPRGRAIASS